MAGTFGLMCWLPAVAAVWIALIEEAAVIRANPRLRCTDGDPCAASRPGAAATPEPPDQVGREDDAPMFDNDS
jgi:hypothetical protein